MASLLLTCLTAFAQTVLAIEGQLGMLATQLKRQPTAHMLYAFSCSYRLCQEVPIAKKTQCGVNVLAFCVKRNNRAWNEPQQLPIPKNGFSVTIFLVNVQLCNLSLRMCENVAP